MSNYLGTNDRTAKVVDVDVESLFVEHDDFNEPVTGTFTKSDSTENHRLDWLEDFKAVAKSEDEEVRKAIAALDARKAELRRKGLI